MNNTPRTEPEVVELMARGAELPDLWARVPGRMKMHRKKWAVDAIGALEAAGFAIVPAEATGEMVDAACASTGCPREFWEHRRKELNAANEAGRIRMKP